MNGALVILGLQPRDMAAMLVINTIKRIYMKMEFSSQRI